MSKVKKSMSLNAVVNGFQTVLKVIFPLITYPYIIVRRIKRSPIRHFIRGCLAASVKRRRTLYEVVPAFYSLEKSLRQFI